MTYRDILVHWATAKIFEDKISNLQPYNREKNKSMHTVLSQKIRVTSTFLQTLILEAGSNYETSRVVNSTNTFSQFFPDSEGT